MRSILLTLVAFIAFALSQAAVHHQFAVKNMADLQFFVDETPDDYELFAAYQNVPLSSGNVILGPPKFPVNIIAGIERPYCNQTLPQFNQTCAGGCSSIGSCAAYYIFEGTNSGTPKLPYWFCYLVNTKLAPSDFVYDVMANFALAYNRIA